MGFQRTIDQIRPVIVEPEAAEVNLGPAEAIAAIGDGIVGTYSGIEQGALREKVTAEIEGFLQSDEVALQASSELPDAAVNEALLSEQTGEDEEERRFFADPVVAEARERTSKLSSAVKAGAMSSSELKVRVQALTRSYINRAPGLAQHFRKVASEVLGDYDAIIDATADQAKSQAKATEFVRKQTYAQAKKLNIDVTLPYTEISSQVNRLIPDIQAADRVARQVAMTEGDKKLSDIARKDGFASFSKGKYHVVVGQAAGIYNSSLSDTDKVFQLESLKASYSQLMSGFAGDAMSPDDVSGRISPALAQLDNYIAGVGDGRELKQVQLTNDLAMEIAESDYFKSNPRAREMAVLVGQWGIKIDASNVKGMIGVLEQVVGVVNGGNVIGTTDPKTPEGRQNIKQYYSAASDALRDFATNPDTQVSPEIMNSLMQGPIRSFSPDLLSNEEMDGLMGFMSRNDAMAAVNKLSEQDRVETLQPMANMFDRFLVERWAPNLNAEIEGLISTKLQGGGFLPSEKEAKGFLAAPILDEQGRLIFTATAEAASLAPTEQAQLNQRLQELNNKYATRFNTLVRARTHLEGGTDYGKWGKILFGQVVKSGGGE